MKRSARRSKNELKDLVDVHFPEATRFLVIQDNLNTYNPAFLYELFKPTEAKRNLDKLDFHFTPKHGSWFNMAEIEFSILSRQCLNRYVEDEESLIQEIQS
jgi:DDE superfamily endonuclease